MRYLPIIRHNRTHSVLATLAIIILGASAGAQQTATDPVEELRAALKIPILDPTRNPEEVTSRKNLLEQRVDGLRTLGELRRALLLTDWLDKENQEKLIADIDRKARARVATRLQEALRAIMQRGDVTARLAAVSMIGDMGISIRGLDGEGGFARTFAPDLAKLMKEENSTVAAAAAHAISEINPEPQVATAALLDLFESKSVVLRRAAASGLSNLVQRVAARTPARGKNPLGVQTTPADVVQVGVAVAPAAAMCLADADTQVRRLSAEAIHQAASALGDLLPSEEGRATGGLTPPERDSFLQLDELEANTLPLARALGNQGAALAKALNDSDLTVRLLVRKALEDMAIDRLRLQQRPPRLVPPRPGRVELPRGTGPADEKEPPVLHDAEESEPPAPASDPVLKALRAALPGLAAGLKDRDVSIRLASLDVLEEMGAEAAPVVGAIQEALRDQNLFVRWAAARTLGKMGPVDVDRSVAGLAELISDTDIDVRMIAARGLERFGPSARAAVPALTRAVNIGDAEVRIAVIRALQGIGRDAAPAIPAIATAVSHPDFRVRRTAAEVLGRFGPLAQSAEPALRRALNDTDQDVRQAASDSLLNIVPGVKPSER